MNKKFTAIIPVRSGSKRLPNKNILPFADSNLLVHKIRQLKLVKNIDEIVVSSNSDIMLEMAKSESGGGRNKTVLIHKREEQFCDEKTRSFNDVVINIAESIDSDVLLWTPCVCPLVEINSYFKAVELFKELVLSKKEFDSIVSAKIFKEYLWNENGPINYNPDKHVPSQFLPDWKIIVNGFYISERKNMIEWKYLYGKNPYLYILDKKQSVDIDDSDDFEIAKALLKKESTL